MAVNATAQATVRSESLPQRGIIRSLLAVMRPHQWLKNAFVLAPVLFSGSLGDTGTVVTALMACATFCMLSSSLYILNDIIDAPADRQHPEKKFRPIASGALSSAAAAVVAVGLVSMAAALALTLGTGFAALAGLYFASTVSYCLAFKRVVIVDCLLIAAGFVLRVGGGAVAIHVKPSHWLIVCAFMLALYLAFSKRRQELLALNDGAMRHRAVLGEYTVTYLDQVNTILLSTVIVCYALYTVAPETVERLGTDAMLYGTIFVLYGLLRYMALAQTVAGQTADTGKLLLRDKPLIATVLAWAVFNAAIIYRHAILAALG